ncbi:hypothetical protein [Pseudactinotalea terrae]|uniref:hypothetical protein n=1 Tax=Pseudactinotalea terrae TaxID=1743262 RepID=UPI0012E15997|nr:hypothetical protein [Pseudactinotalea terrae]
MKRLFWIGVGVAVTVVVLKQVSKLNNRVNDVAIAVSPAGIAASISSLADNVGTLGTQLRESMAANEEALRNALLPDEQTLARARETRAAHRARPSSAVDDDDILPDDGTDYF